MKVSGPNSVTTPQAGSAARRSPGGGFSLGDAEESATTSGSARTLGVGGVSTVDALIALQQVDEPMTRRRRAVRRAGRLLDELERLKLGLLAGELGESDLRRLAAAIQEHRDSTQDPALEALLDQIETRAAVEIAKLESRLGGV